MYKALIVVLLVVLIGAVIWNGLGRGDSEPDAPRQFSSQFYLEPSNSDLQRQIDQLNQPTFQDYLAERFGLEPSINDLESRIRELERENCDYFLGC